MQCDVMHRDCFGINMDEYIRLQVKQHVGYIVTGLLNLSTSLFKCLSLDIANHYKSLDETDSFSESQDNISRLSRLPLTIIHTSSPNKRANVKSRRQIKMHL